MIFALAATTTEVAVASVGFVVPQRALAYHHHHHNNDIKRKQNISQANLCSDQTVCVNESSNSANLDK
jgi:hypothetical protein